MVRVARSLPHPVRSLVFDSSVMGDPHTFVTCLTDRFPYLYPHQSYAGDLILSVVDHNVILDTTASCGSTRQVRSHLALWSLGIPSLPGLLTFSCRLQAPMYFLVNCAHSYPWTCSLCITDDCRPQLTVNPKESKHDDGPQTFFWPQISSVLLSKSFSSGHHELLN